MPEWMSAARLHVDVVADACTTDQPLSDVLTTNYVLADVCGMDWYVLGRLRNDWYVRGQGQVNSGVDRGACARLLPFGIGALKARPLVSGLIIPLALGDVLIPDKGDAAADAH